MSEKFLHFIWNMGLFQKNNLKAISGEEIEIVKLGVPNTDAGPDFMNAQVRINGTLWAGNIEIHKLASDWQKHNHHQNVNYDNVILHVVNKHDHETFRVNGEIIPTIELKYPNEYLKRYTELEISDKWIPCVDNIQKVDKILISSWMETMLVDRLEEKSTSIQALLQETNGDWEQAFFVTFCKSFGQKVNGLPFEQLGKSLPVQQLSKYHDHKLFLEAILFGQAGMLENQPKDEYHAYLQKEFHHLRRKHHLQPIDAGIWKFHRLRPLNFPTVRIAQLASFLNQNTSLLSNVVKKKTVHELQEFLSIEATGYWKNHYQFGKISNEKTKKLGNATLDIIIINTIVPFLFIYGAHTGKPYLKDHAMNLLYEISPEKNSIIDKWTGLGIKVQSAFDTQALIQLKNKYCDARKCLSCRIGTKIISGNYV